MGGIRNKERLEQEGYGDAKAGITAEECPYSSGGWADDYRRDPWMKGWMNHRREQATGAKR